MHSTFSSKLLLTCSLLIAGSVFAQQSATEQPAQASTQSGYGGEKTFGGASGVSRELEKTDENRDSVFQPEALQRTFEPYFAWKKGLHENHGLKIGLNMLLLYQYASEEVGEEEESDTSGGIYRFQGSWTAFKSGANGSGKVEWRLESRSNIGGDFSPQEFGGQLTAAANTGFPYGNNFDADFGVLNWTQLLNNGRTGYAIGRLAFDAYMDSFVIQSPYEGFLNRSFVLNPTLATTGVGALGAVIKGHVTDNFWLGAQIYDGNAANGEFDFDTFEQHEWLKSAEIGWTPAFSRRGTDRIQLTYWEKDTRREAGISAGSGWALSGSYQLTEALLPFIRAGHSDGGAGVAAESALSLGVRYAPWKERTWSLGVGWAEPSEETHGSGIEDEYVVETSYKMQLTKNFSLTPDVQLVFDPAKSPEEDRVWVVGLRGILTL
jgi:porin